MLDLLYVDIDFALCCINVRPALLRNGEGKEMLSVVNILLIIIPTPNNCLHFNQKLVECSKCALVT